MRMKCSILLLATGIILSFLSGCKKGKDIYKSYYGSWYAQGCVSNGGPQNCGLPYPIPRQMNIALTLNIDKTCVETSGSLTKQGTYIIQRAKDLNGGDIEFDKLIQNYNGQRAEYKIEIETDGSLTVHGMYLGYNYIK